MSKTVLSLIQPTGDLHLGNYFGAIKNWVTLQDSYRCFFGVADYHTMTMPYSPASLKANTWEMAFRLVACGVKPESIFIQSLIPEHTELCWILSSVCSYGELTRMTQFKDKSIQTKDQSSDAFVSAGLLYYPVLQAADILIYHADYVPIGKDQEQHLELSRNIAARFNSIFNLDYFQFPESLHTEVPKVLSLADPEKKMSKSLGEKHYINLFGDAEKIRKQVRSAVTDSGPSVDGGMSPGVQNLFTLLKALGKTEIYNFFEEEWRQGAIQYGAFKNVVADAIIELTDKSNKQLKAIKEDAPHYTNLIYESSASIRNIARQTLQDIREITGLTTQKWPS
ncbi:MAG TPA: tryptophan--tRNA ligase [Saprospiraceae bacterium]|nr:tryptophan--tRNA ligase [Saprospiraceae bacterium]